jgi:hypothetical protein
MVMSEMLLIPGATIVGGAFALKVVWWLIGDLVLDRVDLPFV